MKWFYITCRKTLQNGNSHLVWLAVSPEVRNSIWDKETKYCSCTKRFYITCEFNMFLHRGWAKIFLGKIILSHMKWCGVNKVVNFKDFSRTLTELKDFSRWLLKFKTFSRLYEPWKQLLNPLKPIIGLLFIQNIRIPKLKTCLPPRCIHSQCIQRNRHSYNSRYSKTFYLFPARTNIRLFDIRFQRSKFFNLLNRNIQSAVSLFFSLADSSLVKINCFLLIFVLLVYFVLLAFYPNVFFNKISLLIYSSHLHFGE